MDNPVDFLQSPNWRKPDSAAEITKSLQGLCFQVAPEVCEIGDMKFQALGFLHKDEKRLKKAEAGNFYKKPLYRHCTPFLQGVSSRQGEGLTPFFSGAKSHEREILRISLLIQ